MGCINLGLFILGTCSASPSLNAKVDVQKVSKQVANTIMNSINEENSSIVSSQTQNISIKGSCCSPIVIDQTASLKVVNTSKMDVKMITNIADSFKKETIKEVDSAANTLNTLLGTSMGPRVTASVKKAIENVTESNNFKQSIQKKMSETFANQGQNINIDCGENIPTPPPPKDTGLPDTGCYITQSFLMEQVSNNIMETMMSDLLNDPQLEELLSQISKKNIKIEGVKSGGFERQTLSWWDSNKQIFLIILFVFLVPLLVKILFA